MQIRDRVKELRRVRASDLKPNPKNWRRHPQLQADALRGILSEIGYADALLARETPGGLTLIDGHLRAETTPDMEVPVLIVDVTEEEADKMLVTLDPLAAMAEPDSEALSTLLETVATGSDAVRAMLEELGRNGGKPKEGLADPDDVPEVVEPAAKRGDVWLCGDHRVMCGDSTKTEDVERLMAGEKAQATVTDPPFGVRDDEWDSFKGNGFEDFTKAWLSMGHRNSHVVVAFFADKNVPLLLAVAEAEGIPYRRALVWRKPPGSQFAGASLDGFWYDFELIQVFGQPKRPNPKATKMAVLEYRTITGQEHGCEKPVELLGELIEGYVEVGGLVCDPFLGSGTTMIAAERLGRRCYGMEIEPHYVDVAVKRWEAFTGKVAVLDG